MWARARTTRSIGNALALLVGAGALPGTATAQYFGRNKVQYEDFRFQVLRSEHFDLHYYPEELVPARDAARMAERWYARLAGAFSHEILSRQPVVLYADHGDFQQTNVIDGMIDESTGGVTEGMQRRVVMPLTSSYQDTDHVLGHELVHAFQYDIAFRNGGIANMNNLPLWSIEGMAEYFSVGRNDPHTAMWLRDAVLHDDMPTLRKLATDGRYFPYRFGHAVWAYIGGRFGDARISELYTTALRTGWDDAVKRVLGISSDSLSKEWIAAVKAAYQPLLVDRVAPDSFGRRMEAVRSGPNEMMLGPSASPDGRYVAFLWARDFSLDIYIADGRTGAIVRRLASGAADSHFDAVSFMGSAGSWSPDGQKFAAVVFAKGNQELAIIDVSAANIERRIAIPGVSGVATPAWSPDGRSLAFSGTTGGLSDLYLLDLTSNTARRLTNDRYADLQPAWSPDGKRIAFASDRNDAAAFDRLQHNSVRIAMIDVASGAVQMVPALPDGRLINPHFSPDGKDLFFLAGPDGFRDLYRSVLETRELFRVTRLATGISGLTALSPALSIASNTGEVFYSVFNRRGYVLSALEAKQARGEPVAMVMASSNAGVLPPFDAESRVTKYLADVTTGMPDTTFFNGGAYTAKPRLSYFGVPSLGVSLGGFGAGLYTQVQAYFTDVLGDHGLFVEGIAQGGWRDLGGQVMYESRGNRWNWGVGVAHIPYVTQYAAMAGNNAIDEYRQRVLLDEGNVSLRYPLSATRRLEATAGVLHIGYDFEVQRSIYSGNRVVSRETTDLAAPAGYTLWQGGMALVGDHSVFGIASPVEGGRYRFELQPTLGSFNFLTALADWRTYKYTRPVTFAARAFHYGRYGSGADRVELGTLFVGAPGLVRGLRLQLVQRAGLHCGVERLHRLRGAGSTVGQPSRDRQFGDARAVDRQ